MLISEAIALLERRLAEEGDTDVIANLAGSEDPWSRISPGMDYYVFGVVQNRVTVDSIDIDVPFNKPFEGVFHAFRDEDDPSILSLESVDGEIDSRMVVHFYEIYDHKELMQFAE